MKFAKTSALTAAAIVGLSLSSVAPAHAGTGKVEICHSNNGVKSYTYNEVATSSVAKVVDGTVVPTGHGLDSKDIIPAFDWVEDGVRYYFPGLNLNKISYLDSDNKTCASDAPDSFPVTPNAPTYEAPSCVGTDWKTYPYGRVILPTDLGEGVKEVSFGPSLNADDKANPFFTTHYALKDDTSEVTYDWAAGQDGKFITPATHVSADALWVVDSKTGVGQCETANTGAREDLMTIAGVGGAVLGLGALFAFLTRRRRTAQ